MVKSIQDQFRVYQDRIEAKAVECTKLQQELKELKDAIKTFLHHKDLASEEYLIELISK